MSGTLPAHKRPFERNRNWPVTQTGVVLGVLITVMFARVITAIGVPSIVNFAHLALAPALALLLLIGQPSRPAKKTFRGVLALLAVIVLSAVVNEAGPVNAVLEFLILGEPFFFFGAIVCRPWNLEDIRRFRVWLFLIALAHMCLSFLQWALMGEQGPDLVKGLFLGQNGGHHVGGALALSAAVYFFWDNPLKGLWVRLSISLGLAMVAFISDSKTVVGTFLAAVPILGLFKIKRVTVFVKYVMGSALALLVFFLLLFFKPLNTGGQLSTLSIRMEHKWSVFDIIRNSHESRINAAIGLGPGHSASRVATIIPDYYDLLRPFGVTRNATTDRIWAETWAHWTTKTHSSAWALTFSWASVWGDLGYLGLLVYLSIWLKLWRISCTDDHTRIIWIAAMMLGGWFTYLEEP
ncbi:MAG: hypothetical protein ACREBC_08680, partial [Pyrinomonadaceae bacterium]